MSIPARHRLPHDLAHYLEIERAKQLLADVGIPPCPDVLLNVLTAQREGTLSLEMLDSVIAQDVALTAGMLRVVNSPFFGLRQRVGSIPHAVRLLGVQNIVNIVIGLMLQASFSELKNPFMDAFWARAYRLAMLATRIAHKTGKVAADEAFTLGLLCDCGVPLLFQRFPSYPSVYREAVESTERRFPSIEDHYLSTSHTAAGYLLALQWKLPQAFIESILRHHDTEDYYQEDALGGTTSLLAVIMTADAIVRHLEGYPVSHTWATTGVLIREHLGLLDSDYQDLIAEAVAMGGDDETSEEDPDA